ncbi:MAG: hypothetical protein EOP06_02785 [Proteobacteria bacterium]|nr:MAG: hypothetical protein EOP06_02785 [Pseudomonadota bacterium]
MDGYSNVLDLREVFSELRRRRDHIERLLDDLGCDDYEDSDAGSLIDMKDWQKTKLRTRENKNLPLSEEGRPS